MAKYQIYVLLKQSLDTTLLVQDKGPVWSESGMAGGLVVNCETDKAVLDTLKWMADAGHYAMVKSLADEDPWPSRDDWIKEITSGG